MIVKCMVCTSEMVADKEDNGYLCNTCGEIFSDYTANQRWIITEPVKEQIRMMVGSSLREARRASQHARTADQFVEELEKRSIMGRL